MEYGSARWLAVLVAMAGVPGCGGEAPEPAGGPQDGGTDVVRSQTLPEKHRTINGLCIVGHEVRTFIPCGSKKVYWIQADKASLESFQMAAEKYTDEPFDPFFAIVEGRLADKTDEGFAADYDGQIFVQRLVHFAPASELDCGGQAGRS